ncbi:hypothetical protein K440DRAFT_637211 [Wilcoxina mikolae CBS 423.85]|nr:hypothetical protein K440DRAFT_637211 [Wilcoxina mikolae CBS 423.85]
MSFTPNPGINPPSEIRRSKTTSAVEPSSHHRIDSEDDITATAVYKMFFIFSLQVIPPEREIWNIQTLHPTIPIVISPFLFNAIMTYRDGVGLAFYVLIDCLNLLIPPSSSRDVLRNLAHGNSAYVMPQHTLTFANNVSISYSGVNCMYQGKMDYTISTQLRTRLIVRLAYKDEEYDMAYSGWPEERCELLAQMAVKVGSIGVLTDGWRWLFVRIDGEMVMFSRVWDLRNGEVGVVLAALAACLETSDKVA